MKDFPARLLDPFEVEALGADDFLTHQFTQSKGRVINLINKQASDLKNPPQNTDYVLGRLETFAPKFIKLVRAEMESKPIISFPLIGRKWHRS